MPFRPGFDPRWRDESDYILGITQEIWEDRGIGTLERYYAPGLIVRSPASIVIGNSGIIAATMATLAEFPDRELPGEDVIWCDTGPDSFLSSHRLICRATHTGAGMYGAPTGRRLTYRILADCWCKDNAVHDEWLVRDQAAIVAQMGETVPDWTRALIAREGGPERCVRPFTPANDVAGPYTGSGNADDFGQAHADLLRDVMQARFSAFHDSYDRACEVFLPGHVTGHGPKAAEAFWLGLRSALPSATFSVDHVIGMQERRFPPRTAIRWSLTGTHDGYGRFGTPTGAAIHVMGITHAEWGPWGLRRDWTLIDDAAIWKQILLATGSHD